MKLPRDEFVITKMSYKKCIKELNSGVHSNRRYKTTRFQAQFVLENIEQLADPERALKDSIQYSIDRTVEHSRNNNMEVDRIGVNISSTLLEYDIYVPIRKLTENTTDSIINLFNKVAQSRGLSLLGEPFTLTVTGIRTADLPKARQIEGSGKKHSHTINKRIISEESLIKIDNKDRYCLFYALEMMRIFASGELNKWQFWDYKRKTNKQKENVAKLMRNANIPKNLLSYDANQWCPVVQTYYDQLYGHGKYKIFIFRDMGYKPIYESSGRQYQNPILLYHHDKHFDGIRYIAKFFNARYYCLSCLAPYSNAPLHTSKCKARCMNCTRVGPKFPCEPNPNYRKICYPCKKIFKNRSCYEHHLTNNICNKSKRCEKCGAI